MAADLDIITASQLKSFYFMDRNNRKGEPGRWEGLKNRIASNSWSIGR